MIWGVTHPHDTVAIQDCTHRRSDVRVHADSCSMTSTIQGNSVWLTSSSLGRRNGNEAHLPYLNKGKKVKLKFWKRRENRGRIRAVQLNFRTWQRSKPVFKVMVAKLYVIFWKSWVAIRSQVEHWYERNIPDLELWSYRSIIYCTSILGEYLACS